MKNSYVKICNFISCENNTSAIHFVCLFQNAPHLRRHCPPHILCFSVIPSTHSLLFRLFLAFRHGDIISFQGRYDNHRSSIFRTCAQFQHQWFLEETLRMAGIVTWCRSPLRIQTITWETKTQGAFVDILKVWLSLNSHGPFKQRWELVRADDKSGAKCQQTSCNFAILAG